MEWEENGTVLTPLTTPIFDFHWDESTLLAPRSPVKTSLYQPFYAPAVCAEEVNGWKSSLARNSQGRQFSLNFV